MAEEQRMEKKLVRRNKVPLEKKGDSTVLKSWKVGKTSQQQQNEQPGNNTSSRKYSGNCNVSNGGANYLSNQSKIQQDRSFADKRPQIRGTLNLDDRKYVKGHFRARFNADYSPPYDNRRAFDTKYYHQNYGHHHTCYNKERFVQAMCQFVLSDRNDYQKQIIDPDAQPEWELIEELRLLEDSPPSCPICLYPPVAAKMTRCGHIFCWPCVLHYLALSDHEWRKCPICYEAIYANQLKSCVTKIPKQLYALGQEIRMVLMKREKGSTLALPAVSSTKTNGKPLRFSDTDSDWSKFLLVTPSETRRLIVDREGTELKTLLAIEGDEPEACFIRTALQMLGERDAELATKCANEAAASVLLPERRMSSISDTGHASVITHAPSASHHQPFDLDGAVYFYQADNCQPIFLHPLNVRMLVTEYGSLARAPHVVHGEILQMDRFVMSDELRHRYRCLSHLPLSATFFLVEMRFAESFVSIETVESFSAELARRNQERQRQKQVDYRQELAAKHWEQRVLLQQRGFNSAARFSAGSDLTPEIPTITLVASVQKQIDAQLPVADSMHNATADASTEGLVETPSFAEMLKRRSKRISVSEEAHGAAVASGTSSTETSRAGLGLVTLGPSGELVDSEGLPAPSYQDSFGQAFDEAFKHLEEERAEAAAAALGSKEDAPGGIGKKGKKGGRLRGKVVFSL